MREKERIFYFLKRLNYGKEVRNMENMLTQESVAVEMGICGGSGDECMNSCYHGCDTTCRGGNNYNPTCELL